MEDKQIYTTARSEEIKRQIKAFSKKIREKFQKLQTKNKEKVKTLKAEKKDEPVITVSRSKEKAQNINVSTVSSNETQKSDEDIFYKKYVERRSKTDLNDKLSIYSIFIYTIFAVIIIIITFGIYVTLPHN